MEKEYACLDQNNYVVNIIILSDNFEDNINNLKSSYGYSEILSCEEYGKPYIGNIFQNNNWQDSPEQIIEKELIKEKAEQELLGL